LRLAGFGVDFTSNGILGRSKLRSCNPDILLVELNLCGLSGLELIKTARSDPTFGDRPIYVFTHANRLNRATRRELDQLATKLFDKSSTTREDLVQTFATTFLQPKTSKKKSPSVPEIEVPASAFSDVALSGAIEELISGVRDQSELLVTETGNRTTSGGELLSRVSSLGSCASAAGLPNLARQAKALQDFLSNLGKDKESYSEAALKIIKRAVEVMSRIALQPTRKDKTASRFTAVFVDEAPYSNRAMEEALLNGGFQPVCFEDAGLAREYLASNRTDLIIANLALPEAHGLAVPDIRQFRLHAETPIIYGPESSVVSPLREQLPTSAPRLDKAPILLTELVLRALNEVHSAKAPLETDLMGKPSVALVKGRTPYSSPAASQSLPFDDDLEIFTKAPKRQEVPVFETATESATVSSSAINRPQQFDQLFTAAGIPSEPIMRAVPGNHSIDHEAEVVEQLPATQTDGTQIVDQPVEEFPPSAFETQAPPPPQPEVIVEDQTAETASLETFPGNNSQTSPPGNSNLELEQNEAAAAGESAEAISNYWQPMNNHLDAVPADLRQQGEGTRPTDASNQYSTRREDLVARVCAAEMALYHAQSQIEQKDKQIEAVQNQLAEAQAGNNSVPELSPEPSLAEQNAQARCAELEQEVTALRQAFEGLNGAFGEPQDPAETAKRVQELEERLSQSAAELEKQKQEQQRAEADLSAKLEAANGLNQQNEAARQQVENRCSQLEKEVADLSKAREELASKIAQQQKAGTSASSERPVPTAAGASGAPASDLEEQVRQGVAALARATAELAKERGERQRSQQRAAELNERLQTLHQDLSRSLQSQREDLARIGSLEEQQEQTKQALDRTAADLEQQQAEHRLAEEQLHNAKELNAQLRKDLTFFEETNKKFGGARHELQARLEASMNAARENEARLHKESAERQRLTDTLEETRRELQNQTRKREVLEQELQTTNKALEELETKLQNEAAERQRLNQAQDSFQRNLRDGSERDLEFSKVQSALQLEQVERKRQETQLARMRQRALDSAHAARALRTTMRRQIREPVENLVHSVESLLELEMGDDQKKLAEAVLQDVLLVQTRLREPAPAQPEVGAGAPSTT
jgi:CheY-like chemotaxis protein